MKRSLSRLLREGIPRLNANLSVTVMGTDGCVLHEIPRSALASGGIGYVYERIVALHYEAEGYSVEERSNLGYFDKGIDLICDRLNERIFVQCKFSLKSFSVSKIEELLYKASKHIKSNLCTGSNYFDLVVPDAQIAFPMPRKDQLDARHQNKAKFAFLRHNSLQATVTLRIREVPVPIPALEDLADA